MTSAYTDKDYFALQAALNQAAAEQQAAISRATNKYETVTTGNIDYFKQLAQLSQNLLAPYSALANHSVPLLLDSLGVNGASAQQAALPQATNIFNQQGINAQPLIASIPGWSYNTASNQAANMMNSMFGYGTNQPTQQVSGVVQGQQPASLLQSQQSSTSSAGFQQGVPQQRQTFDPRFAQDASTNPFLTTGQTKAISDSEAARIAPINDKISRIQESLNNNAAALQKVQSNPQALNYQAEVDRLGTSTTNLNKLLQEQQNLLKARPQAPAPIPAQTPTTGVQQALGPVNVPVFNQPQFQDQRNNELIDFVSRFKQTQDSLNADANGGLVSQFTGQGGQIADDAANQIIQEAMNSSVLKNIMDATIKSGSDAVQNQAAARGMLNSGQTLAELQRVGTNAAGQYIVPLASQLANTRLNNYYQLLGQTRSNQANMAGQGLNFANQLMNNQLGLTQNLAGQYNQMGSQFANNLLSGSQSQATAQQNMQLGGLNSLLGSGQQATGAMVNNYGNLGTNTAGQGLAFADMYGNAQMTSAGIEANRLQQAAQLQIMMDQYDRQKKANSFGQMFNGGGLALSLGAMALGGL